MTTTPATRGTAAVMRQRWVPLLVIAGGSAAGLALGAANGSTGWPSYLVVLVLGAAVAVAIHVRVGLSDLAIWGLVVFGLGHVAGGMIPVGDGVLYERWLIGRVVRFDNLQHAWGFGIAGRVVWESLWRQLAGVPGPRLLAVVVIVLGGTGLGAVNEVVEYFLTLALPETNVGGYDNTARDLVANLTGASVAAALTARPLPRRGR